MCIRAYHRVPIGASRVEEGGGGLHALEEKTLALEGGDHLALCPRQNHVHQNKIEGSKKQEVGSDNSGKVKRTNF